MLYNNKQFQSDSLPGSPTGNPTKTPLTKRQHSKGKQYQKSISFRKRAFGDFSRNSSITSAKSAGTVNRSLEATIFNFIRELEDNLNSYRWSLFPTTRFLEPKGRPRFFGAAPTLPEAAVAPAPLTPSSTEPFSWTPEGVRGPPSLSSFSWEGFNPSMELTSTVGLTFPYPITKFLSAKLEIITVQVKNFFTGIYVFNGITVKYGFTGIYGDYGNTVKIGKIVINGISGKVEETIKTDCSESPSL